MLSRSIRALGNLILDYFVTLLVYLSSLWQKRKETLAKGEDRRTKMKKPEFKKTRDLRSPFYMPNSTNILDWLPEGKSRKSIPSLQSPEHTEKNPAYGKRKWVLTPQDIEFPSKARLAFQPSGRWSRKPANNFFPAKFGSKSKILKSNRRAQDPTPILPSLLEKFADKLTPNFRMSKSFTPDYRGQYFHENLPGQEPELPDFAWHENGLPKGQKTGNSATRMSSEKTSNSNIPELPLHEWAKFAPLTMEAIDPIYDQLFKVSGGQMYSLKDLENLTPGNLRWAACHTEDPVLEVDWDTYLEYRKQRAEAEKRLRSERERAPKARTPDPYDLSHSQINALLITDFSKASVEEVYYTIAACTARVDPSAEFLKMISQKYQIRTDIDWEYYIKHYFYRVQNGSPKSPSKNSTDDAHIPSRSRYAMNERGRLVDILGNEIRYAKNTIGNLSPELDIELTMTGGLHPIDPKPDKHRFNRIREKILDSASISDVGDLVNDNIQTWRLIRGNDLPKSLWEFHLYKLNRPHQAFADALKRHDPPIRLNEYYISKTALMNVLKLKDEVVNRNPAIVELRSRRKVRKDMDKETREALDQVNKAIDRHTINLLIVFGGRFMTPEEQAMSGPMPFGLENAWFPENLRSFDLVEDRAQWDDDQKKYWAQLGLQVDHYWKFLGDQAYKYWDSVSSIIEAARITPVQEQREDSGEMEEEDPNEFHATEFQTTVPEENEADEGEDEIT